MHTIQQKILSKFRFLFSKLRMGPKILHYHHLPGAAAAAAAVGPCTTIWIAKIWEVTVSPFSTSENLLEMHSSGFTFDPLNHKVWRWLCVWISPAGGSEACSSLRICTLLHCITICHHLTWPRGSWVLPSLSVTKPSPVGYLGFQKGNF